MSKPARLEMDLEVGESLVGFHAVPDDVIEAAKRLFEAGTTDAQHESVEIWRLATKFMVSGPATIETPEGPLSVIICGFALARPRSEQSLAKFQEMARRASVIQQAAAQRREEEGP